MSIFFKALQLLCLWEGNEWREPEEVAIVQYHLAKLRPGTAATFSTPILSKLAAIGDGDQRKHGTSCIT